MYLKDVELKRRKKEDLTLSAILRSDGLKINAVGMPLPSIREQVSKVDTKVRSYNNLK